MVPFAAGVNRRTALKSGFDGEITPHRTTSRSARAAHEITQTGELVPASTSASTMPSERIIRKPGTDSDRHRVCRPAHLFNHCGGRVARHLQYFRKEQPCSRNRAFYITSVTRLLLQYIHQVLQRPPSSTRQDKSSTGQYKWLLGGPANTRLRITAPGSCAAARSAARRRRCQVFFAWHVDGLAYQAVGGALRLREDVPELASTFRPWRKRARSFCRYGRAGS
jgi:hypothetical protein